MKIQFSDHTKDNHSDVLVLGVFKAEKGDVLLNAAERRDLKAAINYSLTGKTMQDEGAAESDPQTYIDDIVHNISCDANFKGVAGQTLTFAAPVNSPHKKIILLGLGNRPLTTNAIKPCGKPLHEALKNTGYTNADIIVPKPKQKGILPHSKATAALADAVNVASYRFDKYITDQRKTDNKSLNLNFLTNEVAKTKLDYSLFDAVTQGEFLAADMGNEPGNVIYPESAAELIQKKFKNFPGVTVKVLDMAAMEKENMGAAIAVGKGSERPPCMVVIEYDGTNGKTGNWPLALVGKGITFDTGGISLKPSANMGNMKMDMNGASAVTGAMYALAKRRAYTKVVAICAFAENMPGGKATRPGDIIFDRAGKSIQIDNTDAEGRLVLSDALDYIQDLYKPKTVVDLATLTGAVMGALGHTYSGVFTPQNALWKKLDKAGQKSDQPGWRLPLHNDFNKAVNGTISDLRNTGGHLGGLAGASTAAELLHQHIKASTNWAHLDIAGTAIPANGIANGHGVRWLDQFIADNFENLNDNKRPTKLQTLKR